MNKKDIIRAWKNPAFRAGLKNAPASPAGLVSLEDAALENIVGGVMISVTRHTEGCTVSGISMSCGEVCTSTTECFCPW